MSEDGIAIVQMRKEFYRDSYRRLVFVVLLQLIIIVSLVVFLHKLYHDKPTPQYFATASDGRIIPVAQLNQPQYSDSVVLQWAAEVARKSYTYNFVNFPTQFQSLSQNFTPDGWTTFKKAMESSNNIEAIKKGKMIVSSETTGAPTIVQKGLIRGRYSWKVNVPILVRYQNNKRDFTQALEISVLIQRMSLVESPRGIGVDQFIASGATGLV
ncbi:MAG TPA: type IVB secretion system apparatus protein IcmL/DotI [Gammaproteobacteria bacterium]|nr:type IVB secretion system apparatus protein IcmL/DotI [Gammaproteobacteria bacterium]